MGSEDWYRNARWNDSIAEAFESKLARSRSQKAQYLRIQGSYLVEAAPGAALGLFERCIAQDDEGFHTAHAQVESARAHLALGDIDAALGALEAAIASENRWPAFRTSARWDSPFVVAVFGREDRYDAALALLEALDDGPFPDTGFEAHAARALIFDARGRDTEARSEAARAIAAASESDGGIPGWPEIGTVPGLDNEIGQRLRAIADAGEPAGQS